MSRKLNILGVTGSIGQSAIDVVLANTDSFTVNVISAHENVEGLAAAAMKLNAAHAVICNPQKLDQLKNLLHGHDITASADLLAALDRKVDITLMAIVGTAALQPTLKAVENTKVLALASKEPVVVAGPLLMDAAARHATIILPVDSEHNALFQILQDQNHDKIKSVTLTASGGPFRTWSAAQMERATVAQALAHPTWDMGRKISIDSATMMNKALEIIEAHYLFGLPPEKIGVLIHPQSVVHALVEYCDGAVLAHMGANDMRLPIAHALHWPERLPGPGRRLDVANLHALSFDRPDSARFPALSLAYSALEKGAGCCIALNAANEEAVNAFLWGRIKFTDIIKTIEYVLGRIKSENLMDLEQIEKADRSARALATDFLQTISTHTRTMAGNT